MPLFSHELGRLKDKAGGKKKGKVVKETKKEEDDDEEIVMEDDGDEEFESADDDLPSAYSDSDEEREDYTIRKTDSLIVTATAESDHSNLEVYLYDHKTSDLYVHHEVILGAYPLCLEWMHVWQEKKSNNVIVGTFLPEIEIWNIDSEQCEPTAVLGSIEVAEKINNNAGKKKAKGEEDPGTHLSAVLSLSLNPIQQEYLASGSEDTTVRIWDLDDLQCKATLSNLHTDKVQVVRWHPCNDNTLLTVGFDKRINTVDVRDANSFARGTLPKQAGDVESATWHPTMEHNIVVSTESGQVFGFDARKMAEPLFQLHAHE